MRDFSFLSVFLKAGCSSMTHSGYPMEMHYSSISTIELSVDLNTRKIQTIPRKCLVSNTALLHCSPAPGLFLSSEMCHFHLAFGFLPPQTEQVQLKDKVAKSKCGLLCVLKKTNKSVNVKTCLRTDLWLGRSLFYFMGRDVHPSQGPHESRRVILKTRNPTPSGRRCSCVEHGQKQGEMGWKGSDIIFLLLSGDRVGKNPHGFLQNKP